MNRLRPVVLAVLVGFSVLAVYCTYVSIHTIDVETGDVAAQASLNQYRQALEGVRDFPYQWRLLGIYMVYAGQRLTGAEPHAVDVVLKMVCLAVSTTILFLFCRFYTSESGALAAAGFYLLATIAGFTDQYTIYFTNDYAMIALFFAAVYAVRQERYVLAAACTLAGSFAKETMLLIPVLVGLRFLRGRARLGDVALTVAAVLGPTVFLRSIYRAPLGKWAWWDMVFNNVPFLQSNLTAFLTTLKNNAKVFLIYGVFWAVAARSIARRSDPFLRDLGIMAVFYLLIAYPVIYIRELRHFLPLAIVVLPAALAELERVSAGACASKPAS